MDYGIRYRHYKSVSETVVRGGPQTVSEEKALQKLYETFNELKIHPQRSVLKVPLLVDLQQKVGELVISITYCPSVIILQNTLS
jgi:hypothetical protein